MAFKEKIDTDKLPRHIAVIMDGNGRWAKGLGKLRIFGHQNGVKAVRATLEATIEIGVPYLTLYAFSSENWNRPKKEVQALMTLLINSLNKELDTLHKHDIRLNAIGQLDDLPANCRTTLFNAMEATRNHTKCTLTLALSYGSRKEIIHATKAIAEKVKAGTLDVEDITEEEFAKHLYTHDIPDPDLMIRTSGEYRISNYLLWQLAYCELWFTDKMWPEFEKEDLFEAVCSYQKRERRFGKTGDQTD
ncbi:isoprenyl transferase [Sphingobacterium sp. SGG-5]|uniref:isoprenyl transferase n=1 Tax=Sphingobacterium sp. SGG-5 TaxID=2710881 RepID=UPI0013ED091E|nr:isoprenyl transferase [Sphingobacterium sp. SGG-5]NGM62096.1 isoprenyl transferase [Sphingobacterium sp. SGG-5]